MMNKTPARPSTLTIVGAIVVSLVLAACGANQTPATASISAPAPNAQFQGGDEVKIEGKVTGSNVKLVDIYVNGVKFATIDKTARPNEFDVSVVWTVPTDIAGMSVVQLKGVNETGGAVVSSDAVFLNIQAQPTATPESTPEPTSVPTAAAVVPTVAPPQAITNTAPVTAPVLLGPRADGDFVNVRAQPDINAQRLGQLNRGQSAPVLGRNAAGNWFQISFPTATVTVGWVFGEVAQITGITTTLPVVQTSATVTNTTATTGTTPTTGTVAVATTAPAAPVTTTTASTVTIPAGLQPPFVKLKAGQDFANVRTGPDVAYERLGQLDATRNAAGVKGKNADASWFQIDFPGVPNNTAWVYALLVDFTGDVARVAVAQAPPVPTAAAPAATAAPAAPAVPVTPTAQAAAPAQPASALLPYSQNMRFSPRDDIGDVPLGHNGEGKNSTLQWAINGATKAELEIVTKPGSGVWGPCPAGNLGSISPNDAAGKRIPLALPNGEYKFSINDPGYYEFTIYVVKSDGSTTSIPRAVIVDCFKSQ